MLEYNTVIETVKLPLGGGFKERLWHTPSLKMNAVFKGSVMPFSRVMISAAVVGLLGMQGVQAGWLDTVVDHVQEATKEVAPSTSTVVASTLSDKEIAGGLREALNAGVKEAIGQLGVENGFFGNKLVKIPMPEKLQMVEKGLRSVGMGKYADDFVLAMNRAAEKAVPETAKIFAGTISKMSIDDARKILGGPDDAATEFFREKSGAELNSAILPIVKEYTQQTEVTKYYKAMMDTYDAYAAPLVESSGVSKYLDAFGGSGSSSEKQSSFDPHDLDGYITAKGVNGLFTVIAEEEKKIRTEPAARTTDLLKKVFGSN